MDERTTAGSPPLLVHSQPRSSSSSSFSAFPTVPVTPSSTPPLAVHSERVSFSALLTLCTALTEAGQHLRMPRGPRRPSSSLFKVCSQCSRKSSLLANHMRVHSGEQPFGCQFPGCTKRFTERSNLIKHGKVHTEDRPFRCEGRGVGRHSQSNATCRHTRGYTLGRSLLCVREAVVAKCSWITATLGGTGRGTTNEEDAVCEHQGFLSF
jgi:uncharacterized Zn-finger protein